METETEQYTEDVARIADCHRRVIRHVQCHSCGYEPPFDARPACCPKCGGGCWETFAQVGKLRPIQGCAPHREKTDDAAELH